MEIQKGSLVYSLAGSDKGKTFLVLEADKEYAYIADGKIRKAEKPKKKKLKHLQKTNRVFDIEENIENFKIREILKTL